MAPQADAAVTEFFAPFVHVEGRYEWCRVRSPTHGVFDLFIVLGESTAVPATVYVDGAAGAAFMADRYPECQTFRARRLRIGEGREGLTVTCQMVAAEGPVREAEMQFTSEPGIPEEVPYGGDGRPVWGGRFTCAGVDLVLPAQVHGHVGDGLRRQDVAGRALLTLGSYGTITPLALTPAGRTSR